MTRRKVRTNRRQAGQTLRATDANAIQRPLCLDASKYTRSVVAPQTGGFAEHIRALDYYDRIPETIGSIRRGFRAEMDRELGADWWCSMVRGRAQYVDVPGHQHPRILRLWTYAKSLDLTAWGQDALQFAGPGGSLVPG